VIPHLRRAYEYWDEVEKNAAPKLTND
jgi:hypothetical protein